VNFEADKMASFVHVPSESDFPIHNLPYGIFSTPENVSYKELFDAQKYFMTLLFSM
jgi:hypothetical protein